MLNQQEPQVPIELQLGALAQSVVDLIQSDTNSMVWIGSGLSTRLGYPNWHSTIAELCKACIPEKYDLPPSLVANENLEWADKCKSANRDKYFATLGDLFGRPPHLLRAAYSHICACPFRFLITTNFDPCLEIARGKYHGLISYPDLSLLLDHGHRELVVYLHGKALHGKKVDASGLVFAGTEFDEAYDDSLSSLPSFLQQVLIGNSTLFVGCGLEEPPLARVFNSVASIHSKTNLPKRTRTILLCDPVSPEARQLENDRFQQLGLDILRYPRNNEVGPDGEIDTHKYLDDLWWLVRTLMPTAAPPSFTERRTI